MPPTPCSAPRRHKNTMVIELPERVIIVEASALRARLEASVAPAAPPCLDASKVTEIDTAGLQLLLCLARTDGAIAWAGVSDAVRAGARLVGLDGLLGLAGGTSA